MSTTTSTPASEGRPANDTDQALSAVYEEYNALLASFCQDMARADTRNQTTPLIQQESDDGAPQLPGNLFSKETLARALKLARVASQIILEANDAIEESVVPSAAADESNGTDASSRTLVVDEKDELDRLIRYDGLMEGVERAQNEITRLVDVVEEQLGRLGIAPVNGADDSVGAVEKK